MPGRAKTVKNLRSDINPIFFRDLTNFVQQLMRDRGESIPPEDSLDVARRIKEAYSYTCADIVKVGLLLVNSCLLRLGSWVSFSLLVVDDWSKLGLGLVKRDLNSVYPDVMLLFLDCMNRYQSSWAVERLGATKNNIESQVHYLWNGSPTDVPRERQRRLVPKTEEYLCAQIDYAKRGSVTELKTVVGCRIAS